MLSKLKFPFVLLILSCFLASCGDKNVFTINGEIKGLTHSDLYFVTQNDSTYQIDTISAPKGKFSYKGVAENLKPVVIYMETGTTWITIWAKNGEKISLKGEANYPELITSKGNEVNKLLSQFKEENRSTIQERGDLRDKILFNSEKHEELGNDLAEGQISTQIRNLDLLLKNSAEDFIKLHPASIASLVLIQDYILDMEDATAVQTYLNLLGGEARENALYRKIEELISRESVIAEGNDAPEFDLVTLANDTVTLDTYKDKYLLLTFYTSSCEPCREEYDSLLDIRNQFSKKDLEILTISLDENPSDWRTLAKDKKMNWDQVVENKGWGSDMVNKYKILTVPSCFLIDKNGTIVGSGQPLDIIKNRLNLLIKGE